MHGGARGVNLFWTWREAAEYCEISGCGEGLFSE
jgi:hypothetical protein